MNDMIFYIICGCLALGVMFGIFLMSRVETSVWGNSLSAVITAAAILLVMYRYQLLTDLTLWVCMALGLIVGLIGAYRVQMIKMPQTVALLNGFGGASSALVAVVILLDQYRPDSFTMFTAGLALVVGVITLAGSLIAAAKLHGILSPEPVVWKGHQAIAAAALFISAVSLVSLFYFPFGKAVYFAALLLGLLSSALFGMAFSIRVGGADMPITISLLNSLSGVAGSIAGMAVNNLLLVSIGGVVGASGLLLTQIMCRSMNRSLSQILLGKTSVAQIGKADLTREEKDSTDSGSQSEPSLLGATEPNYGASSSGNQANPGMAAAPEIAAAVLQESKKVIIIPGYGMALSQAQDLVKKLADVLESKGSEVLFAIHPVAGRMPGHMNVLLCEVDIPYDQLYEMDTVNPQFPDCDAAVVIGANDVVNPAANTAEGTPIYGMPVLKAAEAKHIIICNYDLKPGYAGVENPLYYTNEKVTLLLGDAKESLNQILLALSSDDTTTLTA